MAITKGQVSYWAKKTGRPSLTAGQASYQRAKAKLGAPAPGAPGAPGAPAAEGSTPSVAAAAPVGNPLAPDSTFNARQTQSNTKKSTALGQIDRQETSVRHDFGIDDPTNPFSKISALKNAYLARQKAASAGLASQGQLYSGSHERALARTRLQEEEARAKLKAAYQDALSSLGDKRSNVNLENESELTTAVEELIARNENRPPAGAAPDAEEGSPGSPGSPAATGPAPSNAAQTATYERQEAAIRKPPAPKRQPKKLGWQAGWGRS